MGWVWRDMNMNNHVCGKPSGEACLRGNYGRGDIWQCDICKRFWMLDSVGHGGANWFEVTDAATIAKITQHPADTGRWSR